MHAGYLIPFLEMCAVVAGIAFLLILGAVGFGATLPSGYLETLVRANLLNTSIITIALLATGAYCGSLILFVCYRH
jgi:hypothetical protein